MVLVNALFFLFVPPAEHSMSLLAFWRWNRAWGGGHEDRGFMS
jgi:hypothetical protein